MRLCWISSFFYKHKTLLLSNLPFVGGFGAKFGFLWLMAGFAGALLFVGDSIVLILILLLAFRCRVLVLGCKLLRFEILLLCWCIPLELPPFLCTNGCRGLGGSSAFWNSSRKAFSYKEKHQYTHSITKLQRNN